MGTRFSALLVVVMTLVTLGCGARMAASTGDADLGSSGAAAGVRLIAPLSTSTVTTQRPTLRWVLGSDKDGAQIDLCPNRACTGDVTTFTTNATHAVPPFALAPGVHFWRARSTHGGVVGSVSTPVWEFWVGPRSAPVDTSWGTTLDVDGDGHPDVAVNAIHQISPGDARAIISTTVYLGGAATPSFTLAAKSRSTIFASIDSAGDVNGDGFGDVVVGAVSFGEADAIAYVYYGGANGLAATPSMIITDHGTQGFNFSVAPAGDVNGDGYADLIVGETSSAYVYFGGADGLSMSSATQLGTSIPQTRGALVASAGDVDGDGYGDVVMGTTDGEAALYFGSATGPRPQPTKLTGPVDFPSLDAFQGFCRPAVGDIDGDGFADMVVSGNNANGFAYVFKGSATGMASPPEVITAGITQAVFGWGSVMALADLDGDGFADLIAGCSFDNLSGLVTVNVGSPQGLAKSSLVFATGPASFGDAVANAGDVNGDGYMDLVVGAREANGNAGSAVVFFGQHDLMTTTPAITLGGATSELFGSSVI